MTIELFEQGPGVYIPYLLISLLITLVAYGSYPLLYAKFQNEPITAMKYRWICFFANLIPMIIFFFLSRTSSGWPYVLWTTVFSSVGKQILERKKLLKDSDSPEHVTSSEPPAGTTLEYTGKFQQPADFVPAPAKSMKTKNRFCKLCGSSIEPSTKKCTGCGKQYFRLPSAKKSSIIPKMIALLSILIAGLCVYSNIQYQNQIKQLSAQIAEQNEALKSLQSELEAAKSDVIAIQDKYREKFSEAYDLSEENKEMKLIYDYCEKNMAFVINETMVYHKPHCFMIQSSESSFKGYSVSAAKQNGYTPCWLCCN